MLTAQQITSLDWQKSDGLLPAIVQHAISGEVLMLGYMNQEALQQTFSQQKVTFFSRSKNRLWTKGEQSQHYLNVIDITTDCDSDALLIRAMPDGPTCHTGTNSCFSPATSELAFIYQLEQIVASRKNGDPTSSYTAQLYNSGTQRIAQKVGEEGVEVALAAVTGNKEALTGEAADLVYHLLVLLQDRELCFNDVIQCLKRRHS